MPSPRKKKSAPRVRRTAEEARQLILDAAEKRLRDGGPEAIRLQDIAADVGISHPTILHHFESRDGLTQALGFRITERLVAELVEALTKENDEEDSAEQLIEHVFKTLGDGGTARLLAWRALSFETGGEVHALLEGVTKLLHERRLQYAAEHGTEAPTFEDSEFVARLAGAAAIGDAMSRPVWTGDAPKDADVDTRFHRWFARLLMDYLEKGDR